VADVAVVRVPRREVPAKVKDGVRWAVALGGAAVIFGAFVLAKGVNPFEAFSSMFTALGTQTSLTGIALQASPLILAGLAVAVPAKAGLVNVGGEGQLILGGVCAYGTSLALGGSLPGGVTLVVICLAGALGGAAWSGLAGVLRLKVGINEAVTTLLLNYIALDLMLFLIYDKWKDPNGSGQPVTAPLRVAERLPLVGTTGVHAGIFVAIAATGLVWWALRSTRWGFQLRVVGGNPEAARRAGLKVGLLLISAMAVGGALAGLGGVTQLAGAEFKLRPGFLVSYGYIAFLASWLARHHPVRVATAAVLLAAIAVSGDSLQLDSGLPAATVNVLMALVLLAVFGWTQHKKAAA